MPEPPPFKTATELVSWMIALSFMTVLGVVVKKVLGAGERTLPPAPSAEREDVEKSLGVSTAGVSDETVSLVAALYADIRQLRIEAAADRQHIDDLDAHIDKMIEGFEAGLYPPWPKKPPRP